MYKFCTVNVNSLINKVNFMNNLALQNALDIISVTETWLTRDCPSSFVQLPGYEFYRGDVNGSFGKHGTGIYVSSSLNSLQIDVDIPNLAIVHLSDLDLFIVSVYYLLPTTRRRMLNLSII